MNLPDHVDAAAMRMYNKVGAYLDEREAGGQPDPAGMLEASESYRKILADRLTGASCGQHGSPCEELTCCMCASSYRVWFADNDLWNTVMRKSTGRDVVPFLCIPCFQRLAQDVLPITRVTWPAS